MRDKPVRFFQYLRLASALVGSAALLALLTLRLSTGGAVAHVAQLEAANQPARSDVYDDLGDPAITMTVPPTVSSAVVPIAWEASSSGGAVLVSFTLVYSGATDIGWQPGVALQLTGTYTQSHVDLRVPRLGTGYALSATVTDDVGNAATVSAMTYVEPARVCLPLALQAWATWYVYDLCEPNDSPSQAWGPLVSGVTYESFIWNSVDPDDYFKFIPGQDGSVQIDLANIVPARADYDLWVYYHDGSSYVLAGWSNYTGVPSESVTFSGLGGITYYVRIYPAWGCNPDDPYRLTATFPTP